MACSHLLLGDSAEDSNMTFSHVQGFQQTDFLSAELTSQHVQFSRMILNQ